jgi:PIN domain nuclease of toxin-antitoxin system
LTLLIDTHLLLWAAGEPEKLSRGVRRLLEDRGNELMFSAASIWEVAIKNNLGRTDFHANAQVLRRGLVNHDYDELAIASEHAIVAADLPPLHKDPFDRILIAQAIVEGMTLITSDSQIGQYPGPIRLVR